ncbi:hypothetical protein [Elizabethkingia anophelis]|uniref:hypothetical protein n=1 Tax=Elizabethkingia anophelis TaxID=1117645 RepID=UPI00301B7E68
MKSKLRKIVIDNLTYLYVVTDNHHLGTATNTLTLKIFLTGHKQTPLIIDFLTEGQYYWLGHDLMRSPLLWGVSLNNNLTRKLTEVNLNEPKYIRKLILIGKEKGWLGTNKIEKQNGLHYLETLGYDTINLLPTETR